MKKFVLLILVLLPNFISATVFELGVGWENMGISPETTWKPYPYSQGSRKAVEAHIGARTLGEKRVYFVSNVRLQYTYNWSLSGAMHLLEGQFGLLGLGIYLTKPLAAFNKEERINRWFATLEVNFANLAFGGNVSKDKGYSGEREWTDPSNQFGNQYYPYGKSYTYFHYSIPVRIQFWKELKILGLGMFFEAETYVYEQEFSFSMPRSIGYNVLAGIIVKI